MKRFVQNLLATLTRLGSRRASGGSNRKVRLGIESLEERQAPEDQAMFPFLSKLLGRPATRSRRSVRRRDRTPSYRLECEALEGRLLLSGGPVSANLLPSDVVKSGPSVPALTTAGINLTP